MTIRDELFGLEQFGIKLGLDSIRALCRALDDPQHRFVTVLVGGTNGKGSVTAMVDEALRAGGIRCGRYTSPHLVRLEERFVVNGQEVGSGDLDSAAEHVLGLAARLLSRGELAAPPTFFEATTAIALELFRRAGTQVAVLEVGLGGRLDATNVVEPLAVAITSVERDHEAQLGQTLEAIAFEKAGIIKPGTPVVIGPLAPGPRAVMAGVASERGAPLVDVADTAVSMERHRGAARVRLTTPTRTYGLVTLGLRGQHQVNNAVVAVRLLETLADRGLPVDEAAITRGLSQVRWPGRLEWLETPWGPLLLDAAHNPAGARSLAVYLADAHVEHLPLVFGAVRDKDVVAMIRALAPVVSRVITTHASTPRAWNARELADLAARAAPDLPVTSCPDPLTAVAHALGSAAAACCAGSIFLIGEVRGRLVRTAE